MMMPARLALTTKFHSWGAAYMMPDIKKKEPEKAACGDEQGLHADLGNERVKPVPGTPTLALAVNGFQFLDSNAPFDELLHDGATETEHETEGQGQENNDLNFSNFDYILCISDDDGHDQARHDDIREPKPGTCF